LGESLSEEQQPKQIAKMLAHLINPLNEAICRNKGTIGHLDGHSFQGFFNAPFDLPNHAEQACQAALQMRSESEPFFHQWQIEELPLPSFSVGLDTGFAITGNFGWSERFHFSATGAPFERSQQLKQLNQQYGSQILLSQEMAAQVMESGKFIIREIDKVRFHDDQEPMTIYELLGATPISSPLHEAVDWYQHGLQFYRSRNFQEAIRYFQEILRVRPDDGPARVMLERSQHYVHYPPSFQWDGTWKAK
jgi:adenylate cyclase